MTMLSRLREKRTRNLATAIPAISATQPKGEAATIARIARIATVAVANPKEEKTAPPAKVSAGDTVTAFRWWLLATKEETAIRAWLAHIGETDPACIAEVIEQCQRDAEAREYFIGRATELNQNGGE